MTRSEAQKARRERERAARQPEVWPSCACGCGEPVPSKWNAPLTYVHNHHRRQSAVEYVVDESGCWLWQRSVSKDGYPNMGIGNKKTAKAHRVYFEREHGLVSDGCELHHTCRIRHCVNPAHLEPLTRTEHRRQHRREEAWAI